MNTVVESRPANQHRPRERVELILSQLDRLPTLPAVAARLLTITTSDESSVRDVVEIIESDASLTAAILRLIRRADLGVSSHGMRVSRAVALLGFNAIRNVVLTVQLYETFRVPDENRRAAAPRSVATQSGGGLCCGEDRRKGCRAWCG